MTRARHIRVFVSSTFRDMQAERDHLVKFTFPQLRKLCESRGVTWGEVDLRWGITNEEQAEGKVLRLCLEEIERCRPYFIGLLGERYGWVPQQIPGDLVDRLPWHKEHLDLSITELEIIHGVLREETASGHGFFYFRDPLYLDRLPPGSTRADFECEGAEAGASLAELKQRIRRAHGRGICRLREPYRNPEQLGRWVLEDFAQLIDTIFPAAEQPEPLDREAADHESFAQSRARIYIGRQEYFDHLDTHASGDGPPLIVLGEPGSGKSALLSNWLLEYRKGHPADFALGHFVGGAPDSASPVRLLRRIMLELRRRFPEQLPDEPPTQPEKIPEEFPRWLARVAARERIILLLDGLNQIEEGTIALGWLPSAFPSHCRVILSTLPGQSLDAIRRRGWPEMTVRPLTVPERRELLEKFLAQYGRRLSPSRVERITSAEQTANPLFLRAMLDELRQSGEHERLGERIEHYLSAHDPRELYERILARWQQDYGSDLVRQSLSLIWAARGLSDAELLDLLGKDGRPLPRALWTPFHLAAEASFTQRSGLLSFFHDYLREAVEREYLPEGEARLVPHRRLAQYFRHKADPTNDRRWAGAGARALGELQFHQTQGRMWAESVELVCDDLFRRRYVAQQGPAHYIYEFGQFVRVAADCPDAEPHLQRLARIIPADEYTRPIMHRIGQSLSKNPGAASRLLVTCAREDPHDEHAIIPLMALNSALRRRGLEPERERSPDPLSPDERAGAADAAVRLLTSKNKHVRWEAAHNYWLLGPQLRPEPLLETAESPTEHPLVRAEAARRLGEAADPSLIRRLEALAASEYYPLNAMAARSARRIQLQQRLIEAEALDDWSQPEAMPEVASALQHTPKGIAVGEVLGRDARRPLVLHVIENNSLCLEGKWQEVELLELLLRRFPCHLICAESGVGDCTLTPLKKLASLEVWQEVGLRFFHYFRLGPEEYLSLATDFDFRIMGIEQSDFTLILEQKRRGKDVREMVAAAQRAEGMWAKCLRRIEEAEASVAILITQELPAQHIRALGHEAAKNAEITYVSLTLPEFRFGDLFEMDANFVHSLD